MPPKRYNFKHTVQLCPRAYDDIHKDDPAESKNVLIPFEPENFKYGVYFNDDYDYSQHLISMNDFLDESKDLTPIDFDKKVSMHPSLVSKTATVLKEFCFDAERNVKEELNSIIDNSKPEDLEKQCDANNIEKFKNIAEDTLDEDLLFALNNAKYSDELSGDEVLDDNFVELADQLPNKFKCDNDMMARFFGDDNNFDMESENNLSESEDEFNFDDDMLKVIGEISEKQNTLAGGPKRLKYSVEESSKSAITCLSALSILARSNEQREARKKMTLVNPVPEDMKKYIIYEDVEYDSDEIDKAVDEWAGIDSNSVEVEQLKRKKPAKLHIPQLMSIPKETKSQKRNKKNKNGVQDSMDCDEESSERVTRMNVSEFHVPRKPNETATEKKERKKNIKVAKRIGQEQKKELRNAFKAMGQ